jgi:hypothetical protein
VTTNEWLISFPAAPDEFQRPRPGLDPLRLAVSCPRRSTAGNCQRTFGLNEAGWRLAAGKFPHRRNRGRIPFAVSSFLKRWWWALLLVAVGLGLARLRFDVDVLDLLPPDEPPCRG